MPETEVIKWYKKWWRLRSRTERGSSSDIYSYRLVKGRQWEGWVSRSENERWDSTVGYTDRSDRSLVDSLLFLNRCQCGSSLDHFPDTQIYQSLSVYLTYNSVKTTDICMPFIW